MLEEAPPCPSFVADGALGESVCHGARRLQQGVLSRLAGAGLRGVEQDVPDPGGAAAAAVVVPETRAQALRDTGRQDRVQAPLPQPGDVEPGDSVHAGMRQRREQV